MDAKFGFSYADLVCIGEDWLVVGVKIELSVAEAVLRMCAGRQSTVLQSRVETVDVGPKSCPKTGRK